MSGEMGRVRVVFDGWPGGPGVATHFFQMGPTWQWAGYKQNVLDDVKGAYDVFADNFYTDMSYTVQNDIDLINPATGDLIQTVSGTGATADGTGATSFGPIATGVCVTWRTDGVVNNKHVRGRTFLVPLDGSAAQVDGTPSSACLADAASFATALQTAGNPYAALVIWSRPVPGRVGTVHPVVGATITDQFAVLRSRRD